MLAPAIFSSSTEEEDAQPPQAQARTKTIANRLIGTRYPRQPLRLVQSQHSAVVQSAAALAWPGYVEQQQRGNGALC